MTPAYLEYFGVAEAPFSIAPDPRYLFMSLKHREAVAHLMYGVNSDAGFVVLTGEVGTGKTTVCRYLMEQLPKDCEAALIFNPKLSALELLASICEEFHIAVPDSCPGIKAYIDRLNDRLLNLHARGRTAVLIIDEAQSLAPDVLEQVRLLTNLETSRRKLLRIILLGQPQLRDTLARPDMAQLAQRIVARHHLEPLSRPDMIAYILHRLTVAGAREGIFTRTALHRLYRASGGVPRLVNLIADRALLGAYGQGRNEVDGTLMTEAAREILGRQGRPKAAAALGLGAVAAVAALAAFYHPGLLGIWQPPSETRADASDVRLAWAPAAAADSPFSLEAGNSPSGQEASEPPPATTILRQGSQGPEVQRLRQHLAQLRGQGTVQPVSTLFDAGLDREIRRFQQNRGLLVDGRVGPQTWLSLAQALKAIPGEPDGQRENP